MLIKKKNAGLILIGTDYLLSRKKNKLHVTITQIKLYSIQYLLGEEGPQWKSKELH